MLIRMIVNTPNLTFLTKRGAFLWLGGWIVGSMMELEGVRGVMGRDWWERGVYWQIIGKMSAKAVIGCAVQKAASGCAVLWLC